MKKIVFYHTYLDGNYKSIIQNQLTKLFLGGLYDACDSIQLHIASPNGDRIQWLLDIVKEYKKIIPTVIEIDKSQYPSDYRESKITLLNLKKMADEVEGYYCYFHSKGVSTREIFQDDWRNSCDWVTFCDWLPNIKMLDDGYDAVGPNYRRLDEGYDPHFSGNYWWATHKHLRNLNTEFLVDTTNIFLEESWIGSNWGTIEANLESTFECGSVYPPLIETTINKYIKNKSMHTIFTPQTREWPILATQHPSAWGNIPTIIKDIITRSGIKTEKAIEFGVEFGYSTSAFANYFNTVDGIDTFVGDPHAGFNSNMLEAAKSNLAQFSNVNLIRSSYEDYIKDNPEMYDFAHVDIIHTYEDTYNCGEWCVQHAEITVFHDTLSFPEVYRACVDLSAKYNLNFYNYEESYGLGILTKIKL
jgi:hypothetical protein